MIERYSGDYIQYPGDSDQRLPRSICMKFAGPLIRRLSNCEPDQIKPKLSTGALESVFKQ